VTRPATVTPVRVTPVETFFDVVFAFTLTQLTRTLEADLTPAGVDRVLLVFGALWWMYGGYAWLTNNLPPRTAVLDDQDPAAAGNAGHGLSRVSRSPWRGTSATSCTPRASMGSSRSTRPAAAYVGR